MFVLMSVKCYEINVINNLYNGAMSLQYCFYGIVYSMPGAIKRNFKHLNIQCFTLQFFCTKVWLD